MYDGGDKENIPYTALPGQGNHWIHPHSVARFARPFSVLLFLLMVAFPLTYQVIKAPLLAVICLCGAVNAYTNGVQIKKSTFIWFVVFLVFGIFWGTYGVVAGKENAYGFLRIYVLWVIAFFAWSFTVEDYADAELLLRTSCHATLLSAILNINYVLYMLKKPSIAFLANLDMNQAFGLHAGYTQLSTQNIGSFFITVPLLIAGLLVSRGRKTFGLPNWYVVFTLLAALAVTVLASRRMLYIIIALTPFLVFYVWRKMRTGKKIKWIWMLLGFGLIIGVSVYIFSKYNMDWDNLVQRMTFSGQEGEGVSYRLATSIQKILDTWGKNIFLGTGGGDKAFEITYVSVFHESGLIGLAIYLWVWFWPIKRIITECRHRSPEEQSIGIALMVALLCQILASCANPFSSFDYFWILYLCVAYSDVLRRGNNGPKETGENAPLQGAGE